MQKDEILRVAAHRSVDSKLQYKIYWNDSSYSWEAAENFHSNEVALQEYWTLTDVEYVNKAIQTDPFEIPCQSIDEILQKNTFKDIIKNPIEQENDNKFNCFSNVIIDSVDIKEKKVIFHVVDDEKIELDLNQFRLLYPQALAFYLTENA